MNKDELIDAIVQIEWPMFAGVNNEGGKAACQMDLATFRIMRISQYSAWGEELLESCLADSQGCPKSGPEPHDRKIRAHDENDLSR